MRRWSRLEADPYRSRCLRSHKRSDRFRIRVNYALLYDRPRLIYAADRLLLQRHVQSNITFHRSSPSLPGHIKLASYVPGELIPCALVWLDPGITPCCKTIFVPIMRNIDSRTNTHTHH